MSSELPEYRVPVRSPGTRGDEVPLGRELTVCIGCSHTYGLTEASETYPKQLEILLGSKLHQVLNMGVPNYGLKLVIDWYWRFAAKLQPSTVVVQIPLFCRQPLPDTAEPLAHQYTMSGGSFSLLRKGSIRQWRFVRACQKMSLRDVERLVLFVEELGRQNIRVIVLIYEAGRSLGNRLFRRYVRLHHDRIARECEARGIPVAWDGQLTSRQFEQRGWLVDKSHPNGAGNEFLARKVHEVMYNDPRYARGSIFQRARMRLEPPSLCFLAFMAGLFSTKVKAEHDIYPLW